MRNSSSDAGPDGPEPRRLRRLTLCPIFDMSNTARSAGKPVPASGVKVCVRRARPVGGTWQDWDYFDGTPPCTTSVAGESVVLDGIPELSELVVTFSAPGYVPSAYAVVTGPGDTDAPKLGCGSGHHWLYRTDALTWLDPGVVPSFDLGIVAGVVRGLVVVNPNSVRNIWLHDARVTIFNGQEPDAHTYTNGAGPFFSFNGVYCPEATSTIAPTDEELPTSPPDAGAPPELSGFAGFSFAQLVEGEYRLEIAHPETFCRTWGSLTSPIFGFQSASSGVVAPVLPGHVTFVSMFCNCYDRDVGEIDPRTCSTNGVPNRPCRATTP